MVVNLMNVLYLGRLRCAYDMFAIDRVFQITTIRPSYI
jgi:hypothetical protein